MWYVCAKDIKGFSPEEKCDGKSRNLNFKSPKGKDKIRIKNYESPFWGNEFLKVLFSSNIGRFCALFA